MAYSVSSPYVSTAWMSETVSRLRMSAAKSARADPSTRKNGTGRPPQRDHRLETDPRVVFRGQNPSELELRGREGQLDDDAHYRL